MNNAEFSVVSTTLIFMQWGSGEDRIEVLTLSSGSKTTVCRNRPEKMLLSLAWAALDRGETVLVPSGARSRRASVRRVVTMHSTHLLVERDEGCITKQMGAFSSFCCKAANPEQLYSV